jgi:hypothetical protein
MVTALALIIGEIRNNSSTHAEQSAPGGRRNLLRERRFSPSLFVGNG